MLSKSDVRAACPAGSSLEKAIRVGPKYWRKSCTTSAGGKGYLKTHICREEVILATPVPKRSRTVASSPQSTGAGVPAGGGTWVAVIRKFSPTNPVGVQLAMAIRPPGRHTRKNSASGACSRGDLARL